MEPMVAGDCRGVAAVKACFVHGADQHAADGGHVCGGGAGHSGKQHGSQNIYVGQSAVDKAHQLIGKAYDPFGDTAGIHDFPCKDKQRDRHQGEGVAAGEDPLGDDD